MKRLAVVGVLFMTFLLTGCFGPRRMSSAQREEIVDVFLESAHSVVTAELLERSEFDENNEDYRYKLVEQRAGQDVPEEFHVIDPPNDRLVEGEQYYLILTRSNNALYPFPLYSSRNESVTTQLTPEPVSFFRDQPVVPEEFDLPKVVEQKLGSGQIFLAPPYDGLVKVSDSDDLAEVIAEADRVWEGSFSKESPLNPYVSEYQIATIQFYKGSGTITAGILLPAGLDLDDSYFILERSLSATSDAYLPFSSVYPAIPASSEDGARLLEILDAEDAGESAGDADADADAGDVASGAEEAADADTDADTDAEPVVDQANSLRSRDADASLRRSDRDHLHAIHQTTLLRYTRGA